MTSMKAWNRARATLLHSHFLSVEMQIKGGSKRGMAIKRMAKLVDGKPLACSGDTVILRASPETITREWYRWNKGGKKAESLLLKYKAGNGGHRAVPRALVAEIHRRATAETGGRDKKGRSPLSVVYQTLQRDFTERKPLPGIDYAEWEPGAEFPWSYPTLCRHKPARTLRAAGNLGASAHKAMSAYVHMNYTKLRKGELYTLDDVRLDIIVIDEATGKAIEVTCYIFMEVGSRSIVAYVMKPVSAIKAEDVDELVARALQTPGFGLGVGYTTHILFERGHTACSESAQLVLEGVTEGRIKVHRTSMNGGVRWTGSARDKAIGNAAGKGVIESFNRWLHYALLHLPGQRGNNFGNSPQNLGYLGADKVNSGTLAAEAQKLAQFNIVHGRRLKLKLPMLYFFQLNEAVKFVIDRHNHEAGHDYSGHGEFKQAEVRPGVWQDLDVSSSQEPETSNGELISDRMPALGKKNYSLTLAPGKSLTTGQRHAIFNRLWADVEAVKPGTNRFAILRRVTGKTSIKEMSDEEFAKLSTVLKAIARPQ